MKKVIVVSMLFYVLVGCSQNESRDVLHENSVGEVESLSGKQNELSLFEVNHRLVDRLKEYSPGVTTEREFLNDGWLKRMGTDRIGAIAKDFDESMGIKQYTLATMPEGARANPGLQEMFARVIKDDNVSMPFGSFTGRTETGRRIKPTRICEVNFKDGVFVSLEWYEAATIFGVNPTK